MDKQKGVSRFWREIYCHEGSRRRIWKGVFLTALAYGESIVPLCLLCRSLREDTVMEKGFPLQTVVAFSKSEIRSLRYAE